jgi:hypothetical protein
MLHQAASQEQVLAGHRVAVALADGQRFGVEIEGPAPGDR